MRDDKTKELIDQLRAQVRDLRRARNTARGRASSNGDRVAELEAALAQLDRERTTAQREANAATDKASNEHNARVFAEREVSNLRKHTADLREDKFALVRAIKVLVVAGIRPTDSLAADHIGNILSSMKDSEAPSDR